MGKLFKPKTPQIQPAARMPDPEDPSLIEARQRRLTRDRNRSGRDSTILSDALMGSKGLAGA